VLAHPVPLAEQGTWSPWLIAPVAMLARKPASLSWRQAGTLPVPALTALGVLDDALRIAPGERLLVNGGGSVTGALIVAFAAQRGVEVLATAGPASRDRVRGAGATTVVDHHDADWPSQILDATGGIGVDAAANTARGGAAPAIRTVRDGGRLATITPDPPTSDRDIQVQPYDVRCDAQRLQRAGDAVGGGRIAFPTGSVFGLTDAARALATAVGGSAGPVALEL
jgi:NADPH:quinone reductase-like Zn-dependent oxidoreductase